MRSESTAHLTARSRRPESNRLQSIFDGLDALLAKLAETAVARDRAGGHAAAEKELLRQHGLLLLSIPESEGGIGATWSQILAIVRHIAVVDSAMAHLLAFQHLQLSGVLSYADTEQRARLISETVEGRFWWGNSANPADPRLRATEYADGLVLNGIKGFCSGTLGSQRLLTTAIHEPSGKILIAVLSTNTKGVTIHDDWDPIGQRQTDSSSVSYVDVHVPWRDVLLRPGAPSTPFLSLRGVLAQLILVNLYLGIAQGALAEAREFSLTQARPWAAAGVERVADDPYVLHRYAEMHLANLSAAALADNAAQVLDAAWQQGEGLTADGRGAAALAVAEAKILAHRAALKAGEGAFDVCGARATTATLGLDRFWRNARTHTLHDPIDYKLRDVGRYALEGKYPEPTLYS